LLEFAWTKSEFILLGFKAFAEIKLLL